MGTYEKRVDQLKGLMIKRYKTLRDKVNDMDIDAESVAHMPDTDSFDGLQMEHMCVTLDKLDELIKDNKDKMRHPRCSTCAHLRASDWAARYGKTCEPIYQVCDHYINPVSKRERKQKTYIRRPSNKACPNYEYDDNNFENRRKWIKKNTR